MAYQKGKGLTSRWRVWLNSAFSSLCLQTIISDQRVNVTSGIKITLASRTFTSVLLIDHNHNQYNKATCKQMQQLPTMLGPAVHRRIRIQPIRLWRPCVMIVRGPSKLEEPCKWIQNCCPKCIEENRKNLVQVFICQIYLSNSPRSTIKNVFSSAYSFLFFILLCF